MTWRFTRCTWPLALAALTLALPWTTCEAGDPLPAEPLRFVRVFALADRADDWPQGNQHYIPIEPKEFERLLEAARAKPSGAGAMRAGRLAHAEYEARLERGELLVGHARFEIAQATPQRALVPLAPCGLALERFRWEGAEAPQVVAGLDPGGQLVVLVERPGTLIADWSLRGHRDASGVMTLALELPRSPVSNLTLDLPSDVEPSVSRGVQTGPAESEGGRRWRVELGGQHHAFLRILPRGTAGEERRLALLRQEMQYDFSPAGLELTAKLSLDVHHEPLDELELELDPELQLASARLGDTPVPWSAATADGSATQVRVEFPEPVLGARRVVWLKALAPLNTNKPGWLPGLRAKGVFWQEGSAALLVQGTLSLDQLLPRQCRQSKASPLPAPLSGGSIELQYFSPDATAQVLFSRRRTLATAAVATRIELAAREVQGELTADVRLDGGQRFVLEADVSDGWLVDSVTAEPDSTVAAWDFDPASPAGGRRLTVRLTQPLGRDHPLRLFVRGRLAAAPLEKKLRGEALRMLTFRGCMAAEELVSLATQPPYEIRLDDADDLPLMAAQRLSDPQRDRFARSPGEIIVSLDARAAGWGVALAQQIPRYTAELHVDAALTDGPLVESYQLQCRPGSAQLQRILVYFTAARPEPPRWSLGKQARGQFTTRRLNDAEQTALGLPDGGEAWELVLEQPHSDVFEITATRPVTLDGQLALSLVSLPEAVDQEGTLIVRSEHGTRVMIDNHRLQPVPADLVGEATTNPVRGSFRYDPPELTATSEPGILVARGDTPPAPPSALAWDGRLDSYCESNSQTLHLARFELQSAGRPACEFSLPSQSELLGVWVDGVSTAWSTVEGVFRVDLPAERRFPLLTIVYRAAGRPLSLWGTFRPQWPELDLPILSRQSTLWLPPEYELVTPDVPAVGDVRPSWRQRIFGALGRPEGRRPFDPLAVGDWLGLASFEPEPAVPTRLPADEMQPTTAPWESADSRLPAAGNHPGWRAFPLASVEESSVAARFIRRGAVLAVGWALVALVLAAGFWPGAVRPGRWILWAGLFAAGACAAPTCCAPALSLPFFAVLAVLTSDLTAWRRRPSVAGGVERSALPRLSATPAVFWLAASLAAVAWAAAALSAEETRPAPARARSGEIYQVFIPVDKDRRPTGERYQVPERFHDELRRRAAAAGETPHGWLLTGAAYHVKLARGVVDRRLEPASVAVRYDLYTFAEETPVRIPLARQGVVLVPDSATLDGRPVDLAWDEAGRALLCPVDGPGPYRLEFTLRPQTHVADDQAGFEMSVPPLPTAALELLVPSDAPGVEAPGVMGAWEWLNERLRLSARLGPASRLAVHWPQQVGVSNPAVEVDELLWLKVRPGSVVVDAMLNYRVSGGEVHQLELTADPRLQLLPPQGLDSPLAEQRALPGESHAPDSPQTIQFELHRPLVDKLTLKLSFLLTGTSGVGQVRLPVLNARGVRSARRWMAVSVDQGLEFTVQDDEALEPLAAVEFAEAWGRAEPLPLLSYRLPAGESAWSLATRQREPQTTVKQALTLVFERAVARVRYDAELMTTAGHCFQHRLRAPAGLEVDQISLDVEGVNRVSRWSPDDAGLITVFLTDRVTGPQKLALRGRLPTPLTGKFPLPAIELDGGEAIPGGRTIRVFRRPPVRVSLEEVVGLQASGERAGDESPADLGRLVASLVAGGEPSSASVSVEPNEVRASAVQVVWFRREEKVWRAEVDCRVSVAAGVLDALRFDIPAQWTGPFEVTPAAAVELGPAQDKARRRLTVWPRESLDGSHRIAIGGVWADAEGGEVAAPDIRLTGIGETERYLVLATQVGVQQVAWETVGLTADTLPERFAVPLVSPESYDVYRVIGERPQATLVPVERSAVAQVRLADIHIAWRGDRRAVAVATYDLEPAGRTTCPLRVPAGWRIIACSVAGLPTTPRPDGVDGWLLPLSSNRFPQRIELVLEGDATPTPLLWGRVPLVAPRLGDLPVKETLWSVAPPPGWTVAPADKNSHQLSELDYQQHRLNQVATLVHLPEDVAATSRPEELSDWYRSWVRRLLLYRAVWRRQHRRAADAGQLRADPNADKPVPNEWRQVAKELGTGDVLARLASEPLAADQPAELWQRSSSPDSVVRCLGSTADGVAHVWFERQWRQDGWRRAALAAALVLAGCLVALLARWLPATEAVRRWPAVFGVAVGVLWWLWLTPSALGWLLIVLSVWAALRSAWYPAGKSASVVILPRTN